MFKTATFSDKQELKNIFNFRWQSLNLTFLFFISNLFSFNMLGQYLFSHVTKCNVYVVLQVCSMLNVPADFKDYIKTSQGTSFWIIWRPLHKRQRSERRCEWTHLIIYQHLSTTPPFPCPPSNAEVTCQTRGLRATVSVYVAQQ